MVAIGTCCDAAGVSNFAHTGLDPGGDGLAPETVALLSSHVLREAFQTKNNKGIAPLANRRPPAFDALAYLAAPGDGSSVLKYRTAEIIFSQGQAADAVFYIQKGKVKITVVSERGKEAVVSMLGPGDFFGEGCIAGQAVRTATVAAMTEASIVRVEKQKMMHLLHTQIAFSELFMAHILQRKLRVEADLVDQLFNSSERRLARLLLLLANYGQEGKPELIIAKISQETLAEMIGTTRSRVSHFMNKFRKLGLISYNGHITAHKSLLNLVLHEQPHIKD